MGEARLYGLSSIVHRLYFRNRHHERRFADTDENGPAKVAREAEFVMRKVMTFYSLP